MSARKSKRSDVKPASTDRLPPHAVEAEASVLGCILLAPKECLTLCVESLTAMGEEFFDLRHQVIYRGCVEVGAAKLDVITLQQWLKDRQQLEEVGGIAYVAALPDKVASAVNLPHYLEIVKEKWLRRNLIRVCVEGVGTLYGDQDQEQDQDQVRSAQEIGNEIEARVLAVNREQNTARTPAIREVVFQVVEELETNHRRGVGLITGVGTGFSFFDKTTGGLQNGEFIILGGRPGAGKSSWVMNVAERVAVDSRIPVWVGSAEMKATALTLRMMCTRARVDARTLKTGFLKQADFPKLTNAAGEISRAPLTIDDARSPAIEVIRARLRRWVYEQREAADRAFKAGTSSVEGNELKLLGVIDYAQKLRTNDRHMRRAERNEQYDYISQELANCAVELNIPVLVAAQLTRASVKERKKKAPTQEDLANADGFTRDADVIGLLWQPEFESEEEEREAYANKVFQVTLQIDKQRNGETGPVEFLFFKWCTRFEDKHRPAREEELSSREGGEGSGGARRLEL